MKKYTLKQFVPVLCERMKELEITDDGMYSIDNSISFNIVDSNNKPIHFMGVSKRNVLDCNVFVLGTWGFPADIIINDNCMLNKDTIEETLSDYIKINKSCRFTFDVDTDED